MTHTDKRQAKQTAIFDQRLFVYDEIEAQLQNASFWSSVWSEDFFGAFLVSPLYWFDNPPRGILFMKSSKENEIVALILIISGFINQGLVSAKGLFTF